MNKPIIIPTLITTTTTTTTTTTITIFIIITNGISTYTESKQTMQRKFKFIQTKAVSNKVLSTLFNICKSCTEIHTSQLVSMKLYTGPKLRSPNLVELNLKDNDIHPEEKVEGKSK